ncbi:MAG: MFS transporter [Ekhidna sp.]
MKLKARYILIVIVIAQFFCTSLWFAGNAIMPDLINILGLKAEDLGWVTSSVQLGFIAGTLVYTFWTIPDRFKATRVFLISAFLGAIVNAISIWAAGWETLLISRFFTGFFLAGIYPVGMKIAADHFENRLGKSLGYLVGALVLGTALPHLLASFEVALDWKRVIGGTSSLAMLGGLMLFLFVPEKSKQALKTKARFSESWSAFSGKEFRAAAFGYFGHMWELYAFWAFVPMMLQLYSAYHLTEIQTSFWSFIIIGGGSLSCVIGGWLSGWFGEEKVARIALATSGSCCLLAPLSFTFSKAFFLFFLNVWGLAVIADSPLFSSLVARSAVPALKGTALTLVTCIGFSITIFSIQLLTFLASHFEPKYGFLALAIGPALGLVYSRKKTE